MPRQRGGGVKARQTGSAEGIGGKASIVRGTHQTRSIALIRAQAQVYNASMHRVTHVVARSFEIGDAEPMQADAS